jgi:hypothetical protein
MNYPGETYNLIAFNLYFNTWVDIEMGGDNSLKKHCHHFHNQKSCTLHW